MGEPTVKLGVLGLHNHYHIYPMAEYLRRGLDGVQLVAVYDERRELAEDFAKVYDVPNVHQSREDLLSQPGLDAVLVMSYTASHHDDVLACVRHGKHILLDKPIAITSREALEMVQAAEEAKVVFMMAYLIRYLPAYRKAKELIESGVIGRPLTLKISIRCPLGFIRDNPKATDPGWYTDPQFSGSRNSLCRRHAVPARERAGQGLWKSLQGDGPSDKSRRLRGLRGHHGPRSNRDH
jgi:predicted dehydrogenase